MKDEAFPESGACDSEAARLLPWFVTGRVSAEDFARVALHLERCSTCRSDLAEQRRIRAALRAEGTIDYAPQAGLAATLARIDELERHTAPLRPAAGGRASRLARRIGVSRWLTAAVIVQAVGLGVLSAALVKRPPAASRSEIVYRTRSAPEVSASPPLIRAVFSTSMTLGDLERLLAEQHLAIVAGPSRAGVFTLGAADGQAAPRSRSQALADLRMSSFVQFAEPITSADRAVP